VCLAGYLEQDEADEVVHGRVERAVAGKGEVPEDAPALGEHTEMFDHLFVEEKTEPFFFFSFELGPVPSLSRPGVLSKMAQQARGVNDTGMFIRDRS